MSEIVDHMVQIAHGLGMRTTAEFVEDEPTLQLVASYGVDRAQGYHIGRPHAVPASTVDPDGSAGDLSTLLRAL